MCRNIKTLFNFDPPVTNDEVRAASLQFVRKISGFNKPSKANEEAFSSAIKAISDISANLLSSLETNTPQKNQQSKDLTGTPPNAEHSVRPTPSSRNTIRWRSIK